MTGTAPEIGTVALLAQRDWVRRVARALVADVNAAEDLEQDLWVEVLERPPRVRSSLRGWLAAALRSRLLNAKRSASRRARRELAACRPEAVAPADVVAEADAHRRVVDAVMEIAEPYRTALLLRFFEELPPAAIAQRLGVPTETVRTRVRRALDLLRARLDAHAGGDRAVWCAALAPLLRSSAPESAAASAGASAGGLLMTKAGLAAAAVILAVGGGVAGSALTRSAMGVSAPRETDAARATAASQTADLSGEVDGVREAGRPQAEGIARPDRDSAGDTAKLRASVDEHASRLAALEKSVAAIAATPAGGAAASDVRSPERRKQALQELLAIDDPEKRRTIRKLVDEIVGYGDEVVPDVQAALDSGTERIFYDSHVVAQSAGIVTGWPGQRTMLYDILREIESPAANEAFLAAVQRAHRLTDYADVFALYSSTRNPAMVKGIGALIPDMLRCIQEAGGVVKADRQAGLFSGYVARFIQYHKLTEAAGAVEDLITKASSAQGGFPYEYKDFFVALLELAPERAAHVVLAAQQRDPSQNPVLNVAMWVQGCAFARLIPYYETLLTQGDLDAKTRRGVVGNMMVWCGQQDGRRIEDAAPFAAFLEARASQEADPDVRAQFSAKLAELKKAIEQAQKQQ
jgi:RNA polymerase sigma-70 factor (ECF subfamily)